MGTIERSRMNEYFIQNPENGRAGRPLDRNPR